MGNRRYTLELKIKFLDAFEKMGSIAGAARAVGIPHADACHYWLKHKDELRADYALSLKPTEPIKQVQRKHPTVPLEEKIRCIMAIDAGLSVHRASIEFNRNLSTVQNWYKAKDSLMVLYYSQKDINEAAKTLEEGRHSSDIAWEAQMVDEQLDKELAKKCKAQAKEIEYLKDKVAFLENLNGILKERTMPVKKDCFAAIERSIGGGRRNVRRLCAIARVSRCGYYKYLLVSSTFLSNQVMT
jgi:transposase-like protein